MREKVSRLKEHIILCGYGQVRREVARVLDSEEVPFVVVDVDQTALAAAAEDGYLYVQGNATRDEALAEAGIVQARGLVAEHVI